MKFTNIFNVYKELLCTTLSEDAIYKKMQNRSMFAHVGDTEVGIM